MEFTSRRWIVGTWHVTFQNDTLTFLLHIRERDCGKKGFCIGVHRIGIKLGFFCNLNHTSKIHNCNPVTDMADYTQVMGDKQVGQIFLLLHISHKIQHLRTDRYVQCGNRLVTDNKFRIQDQCPCNSDSLPLTA